MRSPRTSCGRRRRCGARRSSRASIRGCGKNLALVVGLQGRFSEAEGIAAADRPSDQAAANFAYLRQMLAQQNGWKLSGQSEDPAVEAEGG